jgi:ribonuclease E
MAQKMLIDATHAEETRVVVVDGNKVEEFDFEAASRRQLAGNIYLAKVTRVEPSLQAAFVDYGGNRHGFLAFSEIHPDYYQIPVADRQALLAEERAEALAEEEGDQPAAGGGGRRNSNRRRGAKPRPEAARDTDEVTQGDIPGMDVVDLGDDNGQADAAGPFADDDAAEAAAPGEGRQADDRENGESRPYAAVDHAAEIDDQIESIADEDVSDEIRLRHKPRQRRYKIQEVIKVRQILLVQVVKEERGNKGAALTTYLSLAGRYCVLMPNTARGGGISRKITNAADRKKLKDIAGSITVPEGAGLIIRTAGAKRTKAEIKRDYEYLMRLWEQIRDLTLKSIAPAPIYEEGNLIKRSIRDLYNRDIDEVWVEGEAGYRVAKDFMKMIMPSHARHVKHYTDPMPLFARYQVESYLASMFNPTVQLPSGGYIVIGVTEALVAIDVNSGRATKEGSIEETALKTNQEAAEEIARQLRLRDLAGLIVIDFIDMEERKNNAAVEKKLKDKLKTDRARIQVGRISGFGLLEMSRQRLRPGMLEATTQPCPHCHGTGLIRSDDSQALAILRQLEEEGTRGRSREVLLKAPVGIINFLINQKREHVAQIETRYGMAVRMEADPFLVSPDFSIEKFKTATRPVVQAAPVISVDTSSMFEAEEEEAAADAAAEAPGAPVEAAQPAGGEEGTGKRKRKRRRRRRGGGEGEAGREPTTTEAEAATGETPAVAEETAADAEPAEAVPAQAGDAAAAESAEAEAKPVRRRSTRSRGGKKPAKAPAAEPAATAEASAEPTEAEAAPAEAEAAPAEAEAAPKPKPRRPRSRKKPAVPADAATADEGPAQEVAQPEETEPSAPPAPVEPEPAAEAPETAAEVPEPARAAAEGAEAAPEQDRESPRRRGWWALRR